MEISLEAIISLITLFVGGTGVGGFLYWRQHKRKEEAEARASEAEAKLKEVEARSAEVDMAQKVQDTYQQILEDKQKEVDDNHRLINELREDRDHYKQGYVEFRDQLDKLTKEFRDFRNQTEEERATMKRDIARNGRQLECMRPFLCGRENCAIRVPVTITANGELEKTVRPEDTSKRRKKADQNDIEPLDMKDM